MNDNLELVEDIKKRWEQYYSSYEQRIASGETPFGLNQKSWVFTKKSTLTIYFSNTLSPEEVEIWRKYIHKITVNPETQKFRFAIPNIDKAGCFFWGLALLVPPAWPLLIIALIMRKLSGPRSGRGRYS